MSRKPWYAGESGLPLLGASGRLLKDVRQLRRGWRRAGPRPREWPPPSLAVPDRPSDLGWARLEAVRFVRLLIQRGLMKPFTEVMTHPKISGREWLDQLERPAILAANHSSHADTPLLLHALTDRAREHTVVGAAADYWYRRPMLGRLVSLWLNTFPFSRTGGAREVLHSSGDLLRSGWHLLLYPEGSRSADGRIQPFTAGVGHLATQTRSPVVPMHVRGSHRVMPKGSLLPLPAPVEIRIGKPIVPAAGEGSRQLTARVEAAVRQLGRGGEHSSGTWIERWRAGAPRSSR